MSALCLCPFPFNAADDLYITHFNHDDVPLRIMSHSIMAALRRGCGHYSPVVSIFFPRVIPAVADSMSTILRHMVWP